MTSNTTHKPHRPISQPVDASTDVEKQESAHQEFSSEILEKKLNGDYSGAVAKTDPEEIKLVKKLDLWIMVSILLCCPVFLLLKGVSQHSG